ncbi:amidase [Roseomonas sp. OT10]|uniref:amidase n=1 Tax=Roseomonas cutis TaxID=2897332 RepID=UPI001E324C55|nr:amidase [Roseomonas sp. OT10]UFN48804.1 amidase [Roseomonas sp. OT10]
MSAPLHFATVAELSRLIRMRRLSPVELAEHCFARIDALDGRLCTVIAPMREAAMAEARAAEAEIAAGRWRGPLHGIPVGLKDIYETEGVPTTGGSALFRDHVPLEDAETVRRLRAAGAVIPAKLNTWEFAVGGTSFDLPWPPSRNPWDTERDPTGSSTGSAVAVAAGMLPAALGSDTGGSIRGPAAWCGIAGHKPTYGLVSRRGVLPLAFSLDHAGPMAWTAEDCALLLQALAGYDPRDPGSAEVAIPDYAAACAEGAEKGLAGLRVGVVRHFYEEDVACEPAVLAAMEDSLRALRDLGASLRDVTLAPFGTWASVGLLISRSESHAIHAEWLRATPELYGAYGRERLMAGAFVPAPDYVNAQRHRTRLVTEAAAVMREVDILVFPTSRQVASPIGEDIFGSGNGSAFFNRPHNLLGWPALSVCNGFDPAGLPIGLHIGGRPFEDALVLKVGAAMEQALGTRGRRPAIALEGTAA